MGWSTPPTVASGAVISASTFGNVVRDDLLYLLTRPSAAVKRDNGATYTTTSTTFVDIDGTNLTATLSMNGGVALVGFAGVIRNLSTDQSALLDITYDSVRVGAAGTNGLVRVQPVATAHAEYITMLALITGLSVGSHTFRPQWRVQAAGTIGLFSGNGTLGEDLIPTFFAIEVG